MQYFSSNGKLAIFNLQFVVINAGGIQYADPFGFNLTKTSYKLKDSFYLKLSQFNNEVNINS